MARTLDDNADRDGEHHSRCASCACRGARSCCSNSRARTAAPYTSLPHLQRCACAQKHPLLSDPKYTEKARETLLALAMDGQEITTAMLKKLKQDYYRKDYNAWLKWEKRAEHRRVRDEKDKAVLAGLVAAAAELGFESVGTLVRTLIQVEPPVRTLIQVEPRTSVDPRLRPCGADNNSEPLSPQPPALSLQPSVVSSPPPALGPQQSTPSPFTPSSLFRDHI